MLDPVECERARVSRNRAYDGRFFTGVRTTGVYCRPVCPVRPARGCNVEFFASAAAAEVAGYRPCLRCRPETAPSSPAWRGSRTTVDRAMRLIHQGALDEGSVQDVATRLGVGARHLSRLFQKHVGARPMEVARTVRVQRAKRLIDETDLPLSHLIRLVVASRHCLHDRVDAPPTASMCQSGGVEHHLRTCPCQSLSQPQNARSAGPAIADELEDPEQTAIA
jgi:AraC family transcriptional regulator, regulatory protein of adaptative response / methylated-DNA-[protein]-cysteine methyltransferase